jgi:hypothetical protein
MSVRLPTRADDWRLMARTLRLVLSVPRYAALAAVAAVAALSLFVLPTNLALVRDLVVGGPLPVADRLVVLAELYPFVGTDYGPVEGAVLAATAALVGANVALAVYHVREHRVAVARGSGSLAGVVLGTLGAGCAACGGAILAGLLGAFGAAGALALLPLDGLEFALLALVVVALSVFWLADGMRGGEIAGCPVEM